MHVIRVVNPKQQNEIVSQPVVYLSSHNQSKVPSLNTVCF